MAEGDRERRINIHCEPEDRAGVYANFAQVTFTDYEFQITFARVDHNEEADEVPGIVVSRVNMSEKFAKELLDALADSWSKRETVRGIQNLPETHGGAADGGDDVGPELSS